MSTNNNNNNNNNILPEGKAASTAPTLTKADNVPTTVSTTIGSNSIRIFLASLSGTMTTEASKNNVLASRYHVTKSLDVISKAMEADSDLSTLTSLFAELPGFPKDFNIQQVQDDFESQPEAKSAKHLLIASDYSIVATVAKKASDETLVFSDTHWKKVNVKASCKDLTSTVHTRTVSNWLHPGHSPHVVICKNYVYFLDSSGHVRALIHDKDKVVQLFVAFAVHEYENCDDDKLFTEPLQLVSPFAKAFSFTDELCNALTRVLENASRPKPVVREQDPTTNVTAGLVSGRNVGVDNSQRSFGNSQHDQSHGKVVIESVQSLVFQSPTPKDWALETPTLTQQDTKSKPSMQRLTPENTICHQSESTYCFYKLEHIGNVPNFVFDQRPVCVSLYQTLKCHDMIKIDHEFLYRNTNNGGTLCAFDASAGNFTCEPQGKTKTILQLCGYALTAESDTTLVPCVVRLKGTASSIQNLDRTIKSFLQTFEEPDDIELDQEVLDFFANNNRP